MDAGEYFSTEMGFDVRFFMETNLLDALFFLGTNVLTLDLDAF